MDRFESAEKKKHYYDSMDKTELRTKLISSFRFFVEWVHVQTYETEFIFEEVHEIIIDTYQKYAEGKLNKRNLAICTAPGCLSGKTKIRINRCSMGKSIYLEDLYKRFNGLSERYKWDRTKPTYVRRLIDGKIQLSKITNVSYSGIKDVYKLLLDDDKELIGTFDHKVMTLNGYKELGHLTNNDMVMVDPVNTFSKNTKKEKIRDILISVGKYHPFSRKTNKKDYNTGKRYPCHRIEIHRAIYEAHLNKLSLEEFKRATRDENKAKTLIYVQTPDYCIHHKDGNHFNNDISNLECLSHKEHSKTHNLYENFNQCEPQYVKVKSIEYVGQEKTYDITTEEVKDNEGNFNANNIIVHNSGKSVLNRYFIDWCFTRNPSCKFLYISATDKVMKELSTEARNVLLLPAWQELFGVEIDNSKLTGAESSKTNWVLKSGGISSGLTAATSYGNVLGISAGNPNTRGFGGCLILDDFQTLDAITQEYQRNKDIDRFKFLQKRRRGFNTGTILIMQRLCLGDIVDYIKENEAEDWHIVEIPELYEVDGEYKARCPFNRSVEELLKLKEKDPFTFFSQHQQAPIQLGGRWFKEEWFKTYTTPPRTPRIVFISTDFAFKKGEERDWSVFGLWAVGEDNNLYLIDWRRFKDDSVGVKSKLIEFFQKSRERYPHITKICVEKSVANTAFIPDISRNNPAMNFVETSKSGMNSKVLYIQTAREFFEAGRVLFPEENKPVDIINEHLLWSPDGSSAHDDCCDMVAQAVHEGLGKLIINSINI